jgi:uncharacterized membrane protein
MKAVLASLFLIVSAALPAAAQSPGALAGTWVSIRQPASTLTIEATAARVSMTSRTGRHVYLLDGAPHALGTVAGAQAATARWDGATLVIQTRLASGAVATERWELRGDDTLAVTRLVKMRGGRELPLVRTFRRR